MKKHFLILATLAMTTAGFAADAQIGVVNFGNCVTDSKLGKQEQTSFESLKTQMSSLLEDTEKQLHDISAKFNDPEYLDGLSPQAEEELKTKFRTLNDEMSRYQNQYYQVLNQANMKIIQTISNGISAAAEKIAKDKKLTCIVNKDACFYYSPALDVTSQIVSEMDKTYQPESKKQTADAKPPVSVESKKETADAKPPVSADEVKKK